MNSSVQVQITGAGLTIAGNFSRSADGGFGREVILPIGYAGTLTGRTDANTGVATLGAGHGIESADKVDVYWATGERHGMVATVTVNEVALEGGAGDDLPILTTALVLTQQVVIECAFDGDGAAVIAAVSSQRSLLTFGDSGPAILCSHELAAAAEPWFWFSDQGSDPPITGNACLQLLASNGSAVTAATLTLIVLHDSTP